LHFATAREAFNIVSAAIDGHEGNPGAFRDYRLKPIMRIGHSVPTEINFPKEYARAPVLT
jgi:hypothetical protein